MYILGISCFYHDAAAAILKDGQLLAAAEEERFTRKKHDFGFPFQAINFCLKQAGIRAEELNFAIFYEKPFLKFERILKTLLQTFPFSPRVFCESMNAWLKDKLWIKNLIQSTLKIKDENILFAQHHMSHAASAFYLSPFKEAAILTLDGVGEWTTATLGIGKDEDIRLFKEIHFPHSLGLLYSTFTAFLGFEVNEGEYKVMGMAPYGKPRYVDKVWRMVKLLDDGSFWLDMRYFAYHRSLKSFSRKFRQLFGNGRPPGMHFFTKASGFPTYFGERPSNYEALCKANQYYADIAASIQYVTEEIILKVASELYKNTGLNKLCLAGGVFLNCVANGRILRESHYDEIYVQPAAGDGGGAVGAAFYCYHALLNKPRSFVMKHAYWGEGYHNGDIRQYLERKGIEYEFVGQTDKLLKRVARELICGKVVGWFQGRFEWGPRALGNRSILADPRKADMKDILNVKIKFREPFRPFAPSVLEEDIEEYFVFKGASRHYPARFMLFVVPVKEEKRQLIPAVVHVDGTSRLQMVKRETNPLYYRLIEIFKEETGIPLLLNTSFNLKGEPIVASPIDALNTFKRSGIDTLVLGNLMVTRLNRS